jgi:phasin family protein
MHAQSAHFFGAAGKLGVAVFCAVHNIAVRPAAGAEIVLDALPRAPQETMMAEKNMFAFDAKQFAEMFKMPDMSAMGDMSKFFEGMKMPGFDSAALMEHSKKNMEALVAANQAAAAGYQDFMKKQMAIFEETMHAAQTQMGQIGDGMSADAASKQAELYKAAMDKALANMTELAEAMKKSNEEVFAIVSARVKESIAELQAMAPKA